AAGADVGDAVAIRIGATGRGGESEVSAEAVGAAEAGAFAEKHEADFGPEDFADLILQRDAGVARDDERCELPAALAQQREQRGEERFALGIRGERGKAVRNDDREVAARTALRS